MRLTKRVFCSLFAFFLLVSWTIGAGAMNTPVTEITIENILAVLDEYDPDDAYIIRNTASVSDPLLWWGGSRNLFDGLDTCVHEQCHALTHSKAPSWNSEFIYLGGGQGILVNFTETYNTVIAAPEIPEEYRTFRYDTYIGSPSPNLSSNVFGVYGLLNEFTAYHRGICVSIAMFDYCYDTGAGNEEWFDVISSAANDRLAFAEFNYYILFYLNYAKEHYPDIYNGIMTNEPFIKAYRGVYHSFVSKIKQLDTLLENLSEQLNGNRNRYNADSDWFRIGNTGRGIFTSDYKKMLGAAEQYSDIAKILQGNFSGSPSNETKKGLGDPDGDGNVTSADARLALRASVKLENYAEGSAQFLAADVNRDGKIGSDDARKILRVSVKLETF